MDQQLALSYECTPVLETNVASDDRSPSVAIVEIIADFEVTDPVKLPALADTIDPDVIDTFVASTESDTVGALCFTYSDWNVFVRADGTIVVADPRKMNASTPLF
ncbi:HalOD1 output domain-containing protein [Salinibaculum salinum]|uniref:HalOD1 output domain-containing protein n=1 Tax=Salinibaculum salinum TaxID=3131996 RepID=UPI0030EB400F